MRAAGAELGASQAEHTAARLVEVPFLHENAQGDVARDWIEPPEPGRLPEGEPEAGHLAVLAANPIEQGIGDASGRRRGDFIGDERGCVHAVLDVGGKDEVLRSNVAGRRSRRLRRSVYRENDTANAIPGPREYRGRTLTVACAPEGASNLRCGFEFAASAAHPISAPMPVKAAAPAA